MPKDSPKLTPAKRKKLSTDKTVGALPRGSAKQVGSSVLTATVSNINGFLANPDAIRLSEYERAMSTDATIASALDFVRLSVLASMGEYQHENPRIQEFVRENLAAMEGNFRSAVGELVLSGLWAGFGLSEIIWTVENGSLYIERLANYHPATIHIAVDSHGYLAENGEPMTTGAKTPGIYQRSALSSGDYQRIPLNKCCLVTHRKRHNNYYGESAIRRIYKNWKYKDPGLEMWAIALDRYGTPVVYAIVPNVATGREVVDSYAEGGKRAEMLSDTAVDAISKIHLGTGLVLENPDPENEVKIGTITTGNNYGSSFENFIAYMDKAIYRGLLIPSLIFNDGKGGMNSTANTHFEVYKLMIEALYSEFIEPFTEQVIGRLVRYNFNENDPGYFPMIPFDATTAEMLANVLDKMVNVGAVDPSDLSDLNTIRQTVGLPIRKEPVIESIDHVVPDKARELDIKEKAATKPLAKPSSSS